MNNVAHLDSEENYCFLCHGADDILANPLLPLDSKEEYEVFVHLYCARTNPNFGFCWCCGESQVFYSEDLNGADECEVHAGESKPDYPDEDAESYIENVQNNY